MSGLALASTVFASLLEQESAHTTTTTTTSNHALSSSLRESADETPLPATPLGGGFAAPRAGPRFDPTTARQVDRMREHLRERGNLGQIPYLSKTSLQNKELVNGSLVRFRGMVQDMFGPELFPTRCRAAGAGEISPPVASTLFRDVLPQGYLVDEHEMCAERHVFYIVPVPGEASWENPESAPRPAEAAPAASQKRAHFSVVNSDHPDSASNYPNGIEPASQTVKQERLDADLTPTDPPSEEDARPPATSRWNLRDANHPIPGESRLPVVMKVYEYESESSDSSPDSKKRLLLGDVVEMIGVLSLDASAATEEDLMMFPDPHQALPFHVAPRIHVLDHRLVSGPSAQEMSIEVARSSREATLELLRWATMGDALAAEYLLLWMLSGANLRSNEESKQIGKLNLGLHRATSGLADRVAEVVELVLPRRQVLRMAPAVLNSKPFAPRRDVETGRLMSGRLQLPRALSTFLLVDETKLTAGVLNEIGLGNVEAVRELSKTSVVSVDFGFETKRDQLVDAPICVVSESFQGNTMIPVDLMVPCLPTALSVHAAARPRLTESGLQQVRAYLSTARRAAGLLQLSQSVAERIESDFVEARRETTSPTAGLQASDLHAWINAARASAASIGAAEIALEAYVRARTMDDERRRRAGPLPQ